MTSFINRQSRILKKTIASLSVLFLFASCEVEFSPNENWKEIPVVYCLLDQDDDTSYVRVQRCFLGEGNQYEFAAVGDSINYPQGALTVTLEEWKATEGQNGSLHVSGQSPNRIFTFSYTECVKGDGLFYNSNQPAYACATGGQLDSTCIYRLKIVKNATGDTIAQAETQLICGDQRLIYPNNVNLFTFSGTSSKTCNIIWSTMKEARRYQPIVRFFYRDFIVDRTSIPWDTTIIPHSIDIVCEMVKNDMRSTTCTTKLDQSYFLSEIKDAIGDDTCNKNIIDTLQIFITSCNEPLAAYLYATSPMGSFDQEPFTYTNIQGGLGVFASRRQHLSYRVRTPSSAMDSYVRALKELGVGF